MDNINNDLTAYAEKPNRLLNPIKKSSSFRALWIGQSLSGLGDAILFAVLPIIILSISGSTVSVGFTMALLTIPRVVLLPFAGLIVDHFSRTKIMVIADTICFLLLTLLAVSGLYNKLNVHVFYGFAVIYGIVQAIFEPAYSAARAQVFSPDFRNEANSLTEISRQIANLIGPSVGGIIISVLSAASAFMFDAFTFAISVISLIFIKIAAPLNSAKNIKSIRYVFSELALGYKELRKHPWLWITIVSFSFVNISSFGLITILIPWLSKVHLRLPTYYYGLLMSSYGFGALLSAFIFGSKSKWRHRGIISYSGIGIHGVALGCMAFVSWFPGLVLLMMVSGASVMPFAIIWEGSLQELVPAESYGRVASLDALGTWALQPLGYVIAGWLSQQIGGIQTILIESVIMVAITVFTLTLLGIREFD